MTPKQEKFAQGYVETGNASEAYRRAYNAGKMKAESIHVNACKLLADANVAQRVEELQAKAEKRHEMTVDDIARMLIEDREFARKCETAAAAVSASMGLAKLYGHLRDKLDVSLTDDAAKALAEARAAAR